MEAAEALRLRAIRDYKLTVEYKHLRLNARGSALNSGRFRSSEVASLPSSGMRTGGMTLCGPGAGRHLRRTAAESNRTTV